MAPSAPVQGGRAGALALAALLVAPLGSMAQSEGSREGDLLVAGASSLSDLLPELARRWEDQGGPRVRLTLDASSRIARQIAAGAPVDLFISADRAWADWLVEGGSAEPGDIHAVWSNELVVVVPRGSARPEGPDELAAMGRIALAGEDVPAGRYAAEALETAGVYAALSGRIVRGGSVRATLEWVARGEVDAGVVYRTDALSEPRVETAFALPRPMTTVTYVALVPSGASNAAGAEAFLDFLRAPAAQRVATASGFGAPLPPQDARAGSRGASTRVDPGSAVRLSFLVAISAVLLGLAPAIGVGWVLARKNFRGKALVSMVFLAPLVVPPVVTGFLLLELLGRNAPLGGLLDSLGVSVPFSLLGAVIAALVVGFPLYVVAVRGAFESVDHRYEELSWTLGVPRGPTFRRVSLPLALPGIAAGALLAFARALGEFGATVVLAGNMEGETRTIALAVYSLLESPSGRGGTWMLVIASVLLSFGALVGYEALSRRQRRRLLDTPGR